MTNHVINELVKQADEILVASSKLVLKMDKKNPAHQTELVEPIDTMLSFVLENFTVRPNCHSTLETRRMIMPTFDLIAAEIKKENAEIRKENIRSAKDKEPLDERNETVTFEDVLSRLEYATVGPLIVYHVLEKAPVNITKTKNWEAFEKRFITYSNRASY